jgi:predicted RND superfamily exporter protein
MASTVVPHPSRILWIDGSIKGEAMKFTKNQTHQNTANPSPIKKEVPPSSQNKIVRFLANQIAGNAGRTLLFTISLVSIFLVSLPKTKASNTADAFVLDNDPAVQFHNRFKELFPKNQFFVIAYTREDLFTPDNLRDLKTITEDLRSLSGVEDVTSLANITDMKGTEDTFESSEFLLDIPKHPLQLETLRQRALANPLYRRNLLSADGRTTALIVYVKQIPTEKTSSPQDPLIENVMTLLEPYRQAGYRFALAGWPTTDYYLAQYMNADVKFFFPASFLLALITIFYLFRNVRLLALAGIGILTTLAATLGLAGFMGWTLNNASVTVIPLVVCLALSDLIHLFSHLDRTILKTTPHPRAAMAQVLRKILFPCLLTSVTTAIGFFSFTFNSVPAIRSFGWLASSGMLFEFIVSFGIIAPLMVFLRPESLYFDPVVRSKRSVSRTLHWIHTTATTRPVWVIGLCLIAVGWAAWESRQVKIETNLVNWFKESSVVRQDIQFIRHNLSGTDPLDVLFQADSRDRFKDPHTLAHIERIQNQIKSVAGIDVCTGMPDLFKEMNKAFHAEDPEEYRLPPTQSLLEQYLLLYSARDLEDYVTPKYDRTRLIIRGDAPGSARAKQMILAVENILKDNPMTGVTSHITGMTQLNNKTNDVMVRDQLTNISQTVLGIFFLMALVLRSWGLALMFLVPNLVPVLMNFGIMGKAGIPFDSGTALISASAFGIVVDDTIHFFVTYRDARAAGQSRTESIHTVTLEKGEASLSSFSIMGIAFGVLMFSHFSPIFFFGLLNVVILLVGLMGDHFLLKSMMTLWARYKGDRPTEPIHQRTLPFAAPETQQKDPSVAKIPAIVHGAPRSTSPRLSLLSGTEKRSLSTTIPNRGKP